MARMPSETKEALRGHADRLGEELASEYGRSRIHGPAHEPVDGWTVVVTALLGETVKERWRVYPSGQRERVV